MGSRHWTLIDIYTHSVFPVTAEPYPRLRLAAMMLKVAADLLVTTLLTTATRLLVCMQQAASGAEGRPILPGSADGRST